MEQIKGKCVICGSHFNSNGDTCNECATNMDGIKRNRDATYIYDTTKTKQLLPSQIGCIDLEWLDKKIKMLDDISKVHNLHIDNIRELAFLKTIKSQLFPLTPLLDDAWDNGTERNSYNNRNLCNVIYIGDVPKEKKEYLNSPIKINKNDKESI